MLHQLFKYACNRLMDSSWYYSLDIYGWSITIQKARLCGMPTTIDLQD